ncbi:MAG: glycosyltransferase [Mangrovibacterium sp.]
MQIRIIGPAYPYRGGLATYNERMAREFETLGHRVELETFRLQYPRLFFPGKTQFHEGEAPKGLSIRRTVNSINPLNWIRTGLRIGREKPDMVIVRYWIPLMAPCFGTIIRLLKRNRHSRVICLADNIVPHEKRPGDQLLTRYFMYSVDGLVAMSKSVCKDARSFRPDLPVAFCPHPLFDNYGKSLSREDALAVNGMDPAFRYLLFFGFIREYKGLDLLLKAMEEPEVQRLPVKLIIAGEFYTDPKPYLKLMGKTGLKDRIILIDRYIPDKEINLFFCAADLVVQPYKGATQSGVTQVAYHFNRPMLVTDVGGLAEIVPNGKAGYVVRPEAKAIASALSDFFRNKRRAEYEAGAAEEKKKFSWEKLVRTFETIYRQSIHPGPGIAPGYSSILRPDVKNPKE